MLLPRNDAYSTRSIGSFLHRYFGIDSMVNRRQYRRVFDKEINMTSTTVKTLKGSVFYSVRLAPPIGFTLHASLHDVDNPNTEIASCTSSSMKFELTYDAADVVANHNYAITACIEHQGYKHYLNARPFRVDLNHIHRRPLRIMLQSQPTTAG